MNAPLLDIATAGRASAKTWKRGVTTWDEVCAWAAEPRDGDKDGPGYVLGRLSSSRRTKETVVSRGVLALDADYLTPNTRDALLVRVRALGWAVVVHSTYGSTPEAPRLRLLVLASRSVSPEEYRVLVQWIVAHLGADMFDASCAEPERFMFRPTRPAVGEYYWEVIAGEPLDVDLVLDLAPSKPSEDAHQSSPAQVAEDAADGSSGDRPVPEDDVRDHVAWAIARLDALAALGEGQRLDWPGVGDVGWDTGTFLAAQRLVEAANSGASYTLAQAQADFMEHAPAREGTYDPAHKWSEAVKTVADRPLPYEHPADVFAAVAGDDEDTNTAGGWQPVDLSAYLDGKYAPPAATLMPRSDGVGLLYPGMTHSIHGESESGKSMIVQAEAARLLKAGSGVLLIDYEADAGSVVERLRLMGVTREQLGRLVYVQPEMDYGRTDATRLAFGALLGGEFALVVIDGVTEALAQAPAKVRSTAGLGGNDDITVWHDRLPRLLAKRTGAAVVLVDHVAKGPDAGRFAIGGQAKMATISGAAYLVRTTTPLGRGLVGEVDVFVAKDRHGYVRSQAGEFTRDRLQHVATAVVDGRGDALTVELRAPYGGPSPDDRLLAMMERVSDFLANLPDDHQGAGLNLLRKDVRGNNDLIGQAVHRLVAEGYVTRTYKGQSTLHLSARPFIAGFEQDAEQ